MKIIFIKTLLFSITTMALGSIQAQETDVNRPCIESIDSVHETDFFVFSDSSACLNRFKQTIAREIGNFSNSQSSQIIDSNDINSFSVFQSKYKGCDAKLLLLLTGFNLYVVSTNHFGAIIDILKVGENTPALYDEKQETAVYQRTRFFFSGCGRFETVISTYILNKIGVDRRTSSVKKEFILTHDGHIVVVKEDKDPNPNNSS